MICFLLLRQFGAPDVFLPQSPCLHLKLHGTPLVLFSVNLTPLTFSSLEPLLALETAWRIFRLFLRQFGAPDVFFPGAPACTWNWMAPLSSFSPSIWRTWRFLPWSPCLHLKLLGFPLVLFSVNLTPLTFSSLDPYLHLKLHGASLVLFSVNLAPLTFSSLEPLLALETEWRPSRPFLRQFGAPDVFFPGAPVCTWNCMAPLSSFSPSIWRPWRFLPWIPCLYLTLHGAPLVLFSVNLAPLTFSSLDPLLALETAGRPSRLILRQFSAPNVFFPGAPVALETAWRPFRPFLRQFGAPDVFFPGSPACTWHCMAPLSSFFPSIWRPWRFLPWIPCLHLKLQGAPLVLFSVNLAPLTFSSLEPLLHLKLHGAPLVLCSVNLAPLTFSSLEPLLALETAWRIFRLFLRQFGAPDVFFPGAPACTWNWMAPLSSFSPSIWRPWRFLPWSPCLHLKLLGFPLVLFSVNLTPLTFSSLDPYLHLKLHGASLVLFSVNLAPLTFSSLEPLLALETEWRPSRPFLRQFGAPDVFFPGAPVCTWNCMAPLSSFSPSIWRPWRFLPWIPCLYLTLHGAPLVLFSVNLAPLTFSSLDPLLALETAGRPSRLILRQFSAPNVFFPGAPVALETAWRPFRPFLRQFGAPDVFFPGSPACTWHCMAPLSSFFPSIWRPWRFLPWIPCLHLKLQGAPLVLFSVNLAPLTFSSLEPLLHLKLHGAPLVLCSVNLAPLTFSSLEPLLVLETAWRPSRLILRQFSAPDVFFPGSPACTWNCMVPLSLYWFNLLSFFFLSCSLFLPFFFLIPFFSSFFLFSPLPLSFPFLFFFLFGAPLVTPGGPGPQSPPKIRPCAAKVFKHVFFLIIWCEF